MNIFYAQQKLPDISKIPNSIFLAGPTPRDPETKSWRPEAIEIFKKLNFDGTLLIPEDVDWGVKGSYDEQVEWEEQGLTKASCALFWIPRNPTTMLALTTNDEWGVWKKSGKVVLGVPDDAFRCSYQKYYAKKLNIPLSNTLEDTAKTAIEMAAKGKVYCRLFDCGKELSLFEVQLGGHCSKCLEFLAQIQF